MKVREVTNTTTNNRIKIGLTLKLMLLLLEKVKEEEEITENMVKNFLVFTGKIREKMNFLRFLQISPLVPVLPQLEIQRRSWSRKRKKLPRIW